MIRYLKRTNIFPFLNKSPIMPLSRALQKKRFDIDFQDHKNSYQNDKAIIDKVIEENCSIYDKLKENNSSLDKSMIKMLQRENAELQKENEILNKERNDLLNKNNELREFLKQRLN